MESFGSSPNYMGATSCFDAKKENSPQGGSECDDVISVSSSTCGSAINGPYISKPNNNGIKYRTSNKKTMKNFGNVRSFRRRAKSRVVQSPVMMSGYDSLVGSSQSSPHYLKATTASEGKKTRSQASPHHSESSVDGSVRNKSLQTLSRTSSLRSVRILIRKTSFRPKRSSLEYPKVSEGVFVDRATYSSTLKDSKFPEPVELNPVGIESEKSSAVKICRYHHCSLHGHCHGSDDPVTPPKRFMYLRRRSLKRQKGMIPKSESRVGAKHSCDRKKNLQKSQIVPIVEPLNQERISDSIIVSDVENKNGMDSYEEKYPDREAQLFRGGYKDIQESCLVEVAFGETSFPERSYQENLNILRKYSSQEQDIGGASFGRNNYCLKCSCHDREEVTSSSCNGYDIETPQNGSADGLGMSSLAPFEKPNETSGKGCPETPTVLDEVTKENNASSSASCSQTSSNSNSEDEVEFTTESATTGDSNVNEAVQVEDSEVNSPAQNESKLQFSKPRHISMWHLIQQHMSSNLGVETTNKQLHGADGESPVDGANSPLSKESTTLSREVSDSGMDGMNEDSERQDIEVRKLFAIKLVREAIEKILLPEVRDQTSDDQSVTSENTPRAELMENNQSKAFTEEICADSDADRREGNVSSTLKDESVTVNDASGTEIGEREKQVVRKSEKKAPKHWSNLKKWILLQRFIRELEKVRRINTRKPRNLPLNPDPETEKVNLRPQTVDERKNAEEWMLDYALRQAVSQLAPTQKRKVSLLVKAFETVVPLQEDSPVQFRIPRLRDNSLNAGSTGYKEDESVASDQSAPILDSAGQQTGIKMTKETEKVYDVNDNHGESSVKFQNSSGERIGELTSNEKSVCSSSSSSSMDDLHASKEENPRDTAGDHLDLRGIHKDTNICVKSDYFDGDIIPSNENMKSEGPDQFNSEPSSTTESLILDGNGKRVATENTLGIHPDVVSEGKIMANEGQRQVLPTLQGLHGHALDGKAKDSVQSNQMDRKNHIKMWHMIYQHVVSGIADKVLDGSEDDEGEENGDSVDFLQPTDDLSKENYASSNLRGGLTKSNALILVKEAVDEILLPEIQDDSSDTQSVTSESVPDQDISERNCSEIGGENISSEGGHLVSEERQNSARDVIIGADEDLKSESQVSKKSELPKPKNWSKLKKLILLKRSIKALEKARKFKPQPPKLLPQTADPEPEKVDLRCQIMDERKKAEQWMLDYAVQHIVTKLTPARKRRVSMLVEAFEAVVPLPEI